MKRLKGNLLLLLVGMLLGMALGSQPGAQAAGGSETAFPATFAILVDGKPVDIPAYAINGTTFVRLVDVGKEVDFNVYWDGEAHSVQVESDAPYLGKASVVKEQSEDVQSVRQEIVQLTNEVRRKNGAAELVVNNKLMEAAQVRATELAATTTYAHTRPDGSKYTTVTDCPYVGENLYRLSLRYLRQQDQRLAPAAMEAWVNSAGHLTNILNPEVSAIGVGIAKGVNAGGEEAWYCVQMFLVDGCTITWVDQPQS